MNLWTVGCADPRLTAPARSPMDKPGKTPCVSPTLPTGRRLPTSFTAPRKQDRMNLISGKLETSSRLPSLAYSSPEAVQSTGTVVIIVIEHNVPHAWTFRLNLILFENVESRLFDRSNSVWILLL